MTPTDHSHGSAPALALLLGLCGTTLLQAQPNQTFVDTVDVQVVEVDVVVTDKKGRPVNGLKREHFELYVDGQPAEITNFYESSLFGEEQTGAASTKKARVEGHDATPGATDDGPLTVVVYLDDLNLYPPHRTRLLRRLEAAVEPWRAMDANFMLARFENRLEVLVPPTRSLDAILHGASAVPKGMGRAVQHRNARRLAIGEMLSSNEASQRPCVDNWGHLVSIGRTYASNEATRAAVAADGLADLVTTLAGVPGKKALVHVTDGMPQRPGIAMFDYLGSQLCSDLRMTAPADVMAEMLEYDESRRFQRISAHANANRVTFYGLDAAGVRSGLGMDISFDAPGQAPSFRNDHLHAMNAQSGLHLLADETGGKALINANDLPILLDDLTAQLVASYSLGFVLEERKLGRVRQISVQLAAGADKGRRIQYRRTYRDKSLDERLAERLLSVAYLGNAENPLGASLELGGTTPLEKKVHELTVGVNVPTEAIVTLPGKDGEARNATAQLRLWLVAVEDEKGARTTVRQKTIAVGGATGVVAVDGNYRVEVAMNLPEGGYKVAVGVRDETTGVLSLLREPVTVPTPEAGAAAN